jgi:carbamoyl-phosphate synthase small subunit
VPAFSVQYHPEAAAGPHDAGYLFDRLVDLLETK